MILKKDENGVVVFTRGKFEGETLAHVADSEPGYLKWVFNSASEDLSDEVFHLLEDMMEENGIEP